MKKIWLIYEDLGFIGNYTLEHPKGVSREEILMCVLEQLRKEKNEKTI